MLLWLQIPKKNCEVEWVLKDIFPLLKLTSLKNDNIIIFVLLWTQDTTGFTSCKDNGPHSLLLELVMILDVADFRKSKSHPKISTINLTRWSLILSWKKTKIIFAKKIQGYLSQVTLIYFGLFLPFCLYNTLQFVWLNQRALETTASLDISVWAHRSMLFHLYWTFAKEW